MTVASTQESLVSPAPIDCETAVRRLWDYLDGRLSPARHAEVEAHLATCLRCPPHFLFARSIKDALAVEAASEAGAGDAEVLRDRVRLALRAAKAGDGDNRSPAAPKPV